MVWGKTVYYEKWFGVGLFAMRSGLEWDCLRREVAWSGTVYDEKWFGVGLFATRSGFRW